MSVNDVYVDIRGQFFSKVDSFFLSFFFPLKTGCLRLTALVVLEISVKQAGLKLSTEIKGMCHHHLPSPFFFLRQSPCYFSGYILCCAALHV